MMARQKQPQHKDDCIKCKLPEDGSYRHCMNCRNNALKENSRLQSIIDVLSESQEPPNEKESNCTAKEKTLYGIANATRLPSYGDLLYALEVSGISDDNVDKIIRRASIYCPTYRKIPTINEIKNDNGLVPRL